MFETDPEKRITFAEIREHKLFAEYFKNTDDQTSKHISRIYDKKFKAVDKVISFIQKSGIQKQGQGLNKNGLKNQPVKPQQKPAQEI